LTSTATCFTTVPASAAFSTAASFNSTAFSAAWPAFSTAASFNSTAFSAA
jgi:hypothetical protein